MSAQQAEQDRASQEKIAASQPPPVAGPGKSLGGHPTPKAKANRVIATRRTVYGKGTVSSGAMKKLKGNSNGK